MSAETLRRAAALMRERAVAATDGPWGFGGSGVSTFYVDYHEGGRWTYKDGADHRIIAGTHLVSERAMAESPPTWLDEMRQDAANGQHIASWHPAVALAVAELLDVFAMMPSASDPTDMAVALNLARAYLGESS